MLDAPPMSCSSSASIQMEGFRRPHLASSKEEKELSSGLIENEQSRNTAVANGNMIRGFGNTAIRPLLPMDSQFPQASAASSAHSFQGGFPSAGTSTTSVGHQFDTEARMTSDNFRTTGNADALSQHRQDTTGHVPFPVWTNFGILPHQQQQSMPVNMSGFQQNSPYNLATAYNAVQLGGTYPPTGYLKDAAVMRGNRDGILDLNISATESSGDGMPIPQAAVADCGRSKLQALGHQTVHRGSQQQNMVISNSDSSNYCGNFDRRFMVLQSGTAAEGCSVPISGSHATAGHPLWGHVDMDVSHGGQHTLGGTASLVNNLDDHSLLNYDAAAFKYMLLNNIQPKNLSDPSRFLRTASGIHIDSGNKRSGVAETPSFQSPLINQLRPGIYPQAWLNQKPCSSSPMYHRRVQVPTPASTRQPMQIDCNFSDLSMATASPTGSVFPGTTGLAGEGRASMSPYIPIQKSNAALIPRHKRKMHPPSGMGDVIGGKTQQSAYAVNFSPARFVPPASDQYLVSPQISQLRPDCAPGPCSVHISMPTPKQEQVIPPQFKRAISRPETPIHVRQPAPSARPPMTQQQIVAPSSSTHRRPIGPLHIAIPQNTPRTLEKYIPPAAPKPKRSKISPVIHLKRQQGEEKARQPLGYKCYICKRDVSYAPEGPITVPTAPPPVAVLPCGHTFHDQCLQAITPKEQEKDPPCIPCAIGED